MYYNILAVSVFIIGLVVLYSRKTSNSILMLQLMCTMLSITIYLKGYYLLACTVFILSALISTLLTITYISKEKPVKSIDFNLRFMRYKALSALLISVVSSCLYFFVEKSRFGVSKLPSWIIEEKNAVTSESTIVAIVVLVIILIKVISKDSKWNK